MVDAFNQRVIDENAAIIDKDTETQGYLSPTILLAFFLYIVVELKTVGKVDPKKQLESTTTQLIEGNLSQSLGLLLSSVAF